MTSCICHKLGICTLTNPSVGDVIYQESRLHHAHLDGLIDYITHAWIGQCANSKLVTDTGSHVTWIGQCANSKLVTDTGSHVTLRIHLMYSMPTFDTLSISCTLAATNIKTVDVCK